MKKEVQQGITVKKDVNFSEWYTQVIQKAELVDIRLGVKGFVVIRPWAALTIENMYRLYEEELQNNGHDPVIMPSVIPESNLKKETSHVKGFTPEVFWLQGVEGEERLALRPTSETLFTPMFALWVRSHNDLPLKTYQKGSVFRLDTKATRPLIRGREFQWIEAHDAFATKKEAEAQVQEDIQMTENVMHQKFGIPFLAMKRPDWDKFAGAEYTIGSDVLMPDGKLIQQPSTHLLGQKFSKAFNAKYINEDEKEDYLWTTAYGPAISRIFVNVISMHGDDKGLVMPFAITPMHVIIIPIYNKENKKKIINYSEKIKAKLDKLGLKSKIDYRENYRPGWKFNEWELKGVPFRFEIGEKELKEKELTLFERDILKKKKITFANIKDIVKLGREYDSRLLKKSDNLMEGKIVYCENKKELKSALNDGKIAKIDWCSVDQEGAKCAEEIEKKFGAEVRGTLANKIETSKGKCMFCGEKAKSIVYVAKSY